MEASYEKIGHGTGKRAPIYRAQAKQLMGQCQEAVPAWIMTIPSVINNLVPGKNLFDVMIVDEASQADITALPILYMAKKSSLSVMTSRLVLWELV